jgi:hypothetical protein
MRIKPLTLIAVTLLIGLSVWELLPVRKTTLQLEFNTDQTFQLPLIECEEIKELLDRRWEITYPLSIPKGDKNTVTVFLLDNPQPDIFRQTIGTTCNSAIEARLNIPGLVPKPGESVISPYQEKSYQRFEWEIKAADNDLKGTIWIYLLFDENSDQLSRIPLFAIPIEIKITSLMGFIPRSMRIVLAGLIIFGTLITFYTSLRKVDDII